MVSGVSFSFSFMVLMPRPGMSELRADHPTVSNTEIMYELYTAPDSYALI
jgi:hypothetical protein